MLDLYSLSSLMVFMTILRFSLDNISIEQVNMGVWT